MGNKQSQGLKIVLTKLMLLLTLDCQVFLHISTLIKFNLILILDTQMFSAY